MTECRRLKSPSDSEVQGDVQSTNMNSKDDGTTRHPMSISSHYVSDSNSSFDTTEVDSRRSSSPMMLNVPKDSKDLHGHSAEYDSDDDSNSSLSSHEVYMFSRKRHLASQTIEHDRKVKEKRVRLIEEITSENSELRIISRHKSMRLDDHRVPVDDGTDTLVVLVDDEQMDVTCCSPMWDITRNDMRTMKPMNLTLPTFNKKTARWDNLSSTIQNIGNDQNDHGASLRVAGRTLAIGNRNQMNQDTVLINRCRSVPSSPLIKQMSSPLHMALNFPLLPPLQQPIDDELEETYQAIQTRKGSHEDYVRKDSRSEYVRKDSFTDYVQHVFRNAEAKRRRAKALKLKHRRKFVGIPSNHIYKFYWDVVTVLLTFVSVFTTHEAIRDRTYDLTYFAMFTQVWFGIDILLNFISVDRNSDGTVSRHITAKSAKYLTTWFPIDALSIYPWEQMLLQPIIEQQNRRKLVTKLFFRSKATVKVTRILRGRHFKFFGRVANSTKRNFGVGGKKLLALIIKYVPKYLLFYRNMKLVILLKVLRQIHFVKKIYVSITSDPMDESIAVESECSSFGEDEDSFTPSDATTNMKYFVQEDENKFQISLDGKSGMKMCKSD